MPETAARWELPELGRTGRPAGSIEQAPPPFEVGSGAGVPDAMLARARSDAQAVGYAAGWASGIRAARVVADAEAHASTAAREREDATRRASVRQALQALEAAAGALEARAAPGAEQVEELIATAALEIAEALVGQVLRDEHTRSVAALRRALALAPGGEPVTVLLNPGDHAVLAASAPDPVAATREIKLIADETIAPGDALATCGATSIDARIEAALARAREALR